MKIAGCVIFFNPAESCLKHIESYINIVDVLYVIDNSITVDRTIIEKLDKNKVNYFSFGDNLGIAYALKFAAEKAIEEEFDFLLTMDQDSEFPNVSRNEIEDRFDCIEHLEDYGIVGLNFNSEIKCRKLKEVKFWLTSGNFINLANYKLVHGFNEELFIDYVDFDLCEQFYRINKKVAYFEDLSLLHAIGNPKRYNILGIKFTITNHTPIRYFYRFRNAKYLYKRNKKFYRKLYYKGLFIDTFKIIFFEKEKLKKLKLIRQGRRNAQKGILGKY